LIFGKEKIKHLTLYILYYFRGH